MDFCNSGKKKKSGTSSRDASRAGTPERGEGAGNSNEENGGGGKVTYALDNVVAESKGWVLDKGAGETILVRYTMIQNLRYLMNMCVYIKKSFYFDPSIHIGLIRLKKKGRSFYTSLPRLLGSSKNNLLYLFSNQMYSRSCL